MAGKKSLLQTRPELVAAFGTKFDEGLTVTQACIELDVPRSCFKEWMRWGCPEPATNADGKKRTPKEPYAEFYRVVTRARSTWEVALLGEIARQGHDARNLKGEILQDMSGRIARAGDWRALEMLLRSRFPKTYAPQVRVVLEEHLTNALNVLQRGLEGLTLVPLTKPSEAPAFTHVLELLARADTDAVDDGDAHDVGARPIAPRYPPPGSAPSP
jgi:hypothetical protein